MSNKTEVDEILKHFLSEFTRRMPPGSDVEDFIDCTPLTEVPSDHPFHGFPMGFLPPNYLPPKDLGGDFKLPVDMPDNLPFAEGMKYYDISNSKPNYIPWLNIKNESYVPRNRNDHGIFTMLSENKYNEGLWNMVQYSMPLYLSNKYHIVNIKKLMSNTNTSNYMSLATYYTMFNEVLGIQYLQIIDEFHTALSNCNKTSKKQAVKKYKEWINSVHTMIKDMKMTLVGGAICKATPEQDFCSSAIEFLLEPCILIQLPWKTALLHQWLQATLTEILKFEIDTIEFRHWPIKNDSVNEIVNELLLLIKNLKERILLGFAIMNEKIKTRHPNKTNRDLPDVIMDEVVLPSLPIIKFLVENKASKMLKRLKLITWSKSENGENFNIVNPTVYLMDIALSNLHVNNFNNHFIWNVKDQLNNPFPCVNDLNSVIDRIKNNQSHIEPYNEESFNIWHEKILKDKNSLVYKLSVPEKIELTLKTIQEHVIDCHKLIDIKIEDVQTKLNNNDNNIKKCAQRIGKSENTSNIDRLLKNVIIYHEVKKLLLKTETEIGTIAQVITLQLQIQLQTALAEIILCTCILFNKIPIYKRAEFFDINLDTYINDLKKLKIEIKNQSREKLWLKLPSEWKQPVNKNKIPEPHVFDKKEEMIQMFETRIGRMVYNMALNSFTINALGCDVCFPDWSIIQYVLPCVVASYFEDCKIKPLNEKMLKLVHAIITFYEKRYYVWVATCNNEHHDKESSEIDEFPADFLYTFEKLYNHMYKYEWLCLNLKVREHARRSMGYFTMNNIYTTTITGIDQILNYMHDWPTITTWMETELDLPSKREVKRMIEKNHSKDFVMDSFAMLINEWWEITYDFTENLFHIAIKLFNIPPPNIDIPNCKRLTDLNLTSAIISELEIIQDLANRNHSKTSLLHDELEDAKDGIKQHRYEILHEVINAHKKTTVELNKFVDNKKAIELNLYVKLKKFRKQAGDELKFKLLDELPLSKLYPEIKLAAEYYLNGKFDELENMLTLFAHANKKREAKVLNRCRQCGKPESVRKLVSCEKCVEDKYPDVNLYCGRRCQETRWKSEHMAEHLEFELGLADFSYLNIGK